jgi:hypothetical protein
MRVKIEEKNASLEAMSAKFAAIRNLSERNQTCRPPKYIRFPFFVVEPSDVRNTDLGIKLQADLRKLLLDSNNPLKIYGDLEVLAEIPSIAEASRQL